MEQIEEVPAGKSERVIGCLAAMRAHIIDQDFISSYIPFVATILLMECAESPNGKVEISRILSRFTEHFGFEIERAPMVSILTKCVRKGIVVRSKGGYYSVNEDKCREVAISEGEVSKERAKYQKVISELSRFYREQYNIQDITDVIVEEKLLLFFYKHSVKTLRIDFVNQTGQSEQTIKDVSHFYIISQFILVIKRENEEIFQLIQSLALAFLMSSCIAYTEERDDKSQIDAFKNLCIYVDTPWLLRIIGANDDEMQAAELALLKRIHELGGHLLIFRHTYDEALHILNDCQYWIDNPECNVTYASNALRSFIKRRFTKEDVIEFANTFDYKLKANKIEIDDGDYVTGRYYSSPIDDATIIKTIEDTYKNPDSNSRGYAKHKTIENDAKSIAYILRRWGGKRANTYRQTKYVLVTTNDSLAYASRKLPEGYNINRISQVYPCITNVYLGTNIWLSAPVKTIESFSMKKLISDCMTQIEPTEKILYAVQRAIDNYSKDEFVNQEKLYLLRTKAFSNDYIMDATLGDENRFNDSICDELIENIEAEIKQPLIDENDKLSSSLDTYKNLEKQKKKIIDCCEKKAQDITKFIRDSAFVGILMCLVTFVINIAGWLSISKFWVLILIVVLVVLSVIELSFKFKGDKIQRLLARFFRATNNELDELMTMNDGMTEKIKAE